MRNFTPIIVSRLGGGLNAVFDVVAARKAFAVDSFISDVWISRGDFVITFCIAQSTNFRRVFTWHRKLNATASFEREVCHALELAVIFCVDFEEF
jgi:hypothetical protein